MIEIKRLSLEHKEIRNQYEHTKAKKEIFETILGKYRGDRSLYEEYLKEKIFLMKKEIKIQLSLMKNIEQKFF